VEGNDDEAESVGPVDDDGAAQVVRPLRDDVAETG
jgi:hypothetical protein